MSPAEPAAGGSQDQSRRGPRSFRHGRIAAAATVAAVSLTCASGWAADGALRPPPEGTTPPVQAVPAAPTRAGSWVARIVIPTTAWAGAGRTGRRLGTVTTQSPWGGVNRLMVLGTRMVAEDRWIRVRLPGRPNAREGWILATDTDLFPVGWRLEISRAERRLRVLHDGRLVRSTRVVVGAPSTPTPGGLFAIADELAQPDSTGFAGGWVLPLTAHSEVLQSFDGGDGQVALHGRGGASLDDPLGTARSHGCIRLANRDIAWLAARIDAGTPVRVR